MASNISSKPIHLEPSPLGTKEYWDALYTTEITNHSLDPTDSGTIWFDDSSAEDKVVSYLDKQVVEENMLGDGVGKQNCSFLDLGMGNGHFLIRLREGEDEEDSDEESEEMQGEGKNTGWGGRMLGVDYSEKSVEFAKEVAEEKALEVEFQHWDIMTDSPSQLLSGPQSAGWDVVVDKGTFDAISLSEEKDAEGRRICEGYKEKVLPLMREGGIFLVTSCNWTEEELKGWFVGGEEEETLVLVGRIEYRSFRFGGKEGQTVCSVAFRKVKR